MVMVEHLLNTLREAPNPCSPPCTFNPTDPNTIHLLPRPVDDDQDDGTDDRLMMLMTHNGLDLEGEEDYVDATPGAYGSIESDGTHPLTPVDTC